MKRTYISNICDGDNCKVQGFVENIRNKHTMAFIVVRDITGKIQITVNKTESPELVETINKITLESFITVEGKAVKNDYVKLNKIEILPVSISIDSIAEPLPIQPDASIDLKMDYRWLELRNRKNQLIFQVQTYITKVMRDFFLERNFLEIHSPKLIGAASESGSDVFELKYFDRKAFLSQSPQFYKQMAMASGFERIFEIGPVFRAEKSYTNKHTTEFTGFDVEMSCIESFNDIMDIEQELIVEVIKKVKEKFGDEIQELFNQEVIVPTVPFPTISLKDLYKELEEKYNYVLPDSEKGDLTTEAEKLSYKYVKETYNHEFLFVTNFSKDKRPFYHMRKDDIPQGYDLIWKGVEITTGSQREHRYDILKQQAEEKGLGEDVKFYTEFFRYGCPPHGGFGIGIDRLTMLFLGIGIKDVMFIFRGPNRLNP